MRNVRTECFVKADILNVDSYLWFGNHSVTCRDEPGMNEGVCWIGSTFKSPHLFTSVGAKDLVGLEVLEIPACFLFCFTKAVLFSD